ncbi:MAG: Uncharacterized protein G01um10147_414 [Microgenomates group bacterium Gr01-1014_7]|nr:MAG: Uncharacterized protein G01um10147_414 [Microgenomates group bacterium Gr01-1014_7]
MNPFKLILFLSILLIISMGVFLFRSNIFTITSIEVEIEKVGCVESDKIRDASNLLGQNFFLLNSSKLENDLKNKYVCIHKVNLSRYFPNKVKLFIFGREPAAILIVLKDGEATESAEATPSAEASSSAEGFVVDNEGVVYSNSIEQINAPYIYAGGLNLTVGQKIKDDFIGKILKILEKLKSFGVDVKETKIYSNSLLLTGAMPRIIFKLSDNIDTQIASLQLILNKAKIDGEILEFIDLRFDKPVVKFAPKKHG